MDIDKNIDFDLNLVFKDEITGEHTIFLPDMPHLTKNIVTALELSSSKKSQRHIKFGKCPMWLVCIENIWLALRGASSQLQEIKPIVHHFEKMLFLV